MGRRQHQPSIDGLRLQRIACPVHNGPAKGSVGSVLLLQVARSPRVHSSVNGSTYTRLELDAGNPRNRSNPGRPWIKAPKASPPRLRRLRQVVDLIDV